MRNQLDYLFYRGDDRVKCALQMLEYPIFLYVFASVINQGKVALDHFF